jgi:juvenile hormone diol kinase
MLSEYRKNKFTHIFKILDFDHNGFIQGSDFSDLGENISIFSCAEMDSIKEQLIFSRGKTIWQQLAYYFKNEFISCNLEQWLEYMAWISSHQCPLSFNKITHQMVHDIYTIYDLNKDGLLSKQEFMCFFVSLRVEIKQANECFEMLDLNGDKMLSRIELFTAIKEFFLSDDPDSPGNLLFGNISSYMFETRARTIFG